MNTQTVKTTIEIDTHLLKLAKIKALEDRTNLKTVVNQALAQTLTAPPPTENPTIGGHHLGGIKTSLSRTEMYDEY